MANSLRDLISPEYRAQLLRLREIKPDFGTYGAKHAGNVAELARAQNVISILDYGSGNGALARELRRITDCDVLEYDPCFNDMLPPPCDLVSCVDVLEHIEPDKLDAVLEHIWELSGKCAYLSISNRPARAFLPDGRNSHLIVETPQWWMARLQQYPWSALGPAKYREGFDVTFWLRKEQRNVAAAA